MWGVELGKHIRPWFFFSEYTGVVRPSRKDRWATGIAKAFSLALDWICSNKFLLYSSFRISSVCQHDVLTQYFPIRRFNPNCINIHPISHYNWHYSYKNSKWAHQLEVSSEFKIVSLSANSIRAHKGHCSQISSFLLVYSAIPLQCILLLSQISTSCQTFPMPPMKASR